MKTEIAKGIFYEPFLSCTGNPAGEFTRDDKTIIGYSNYDHISGVTPEANETEREWFKTQGWVTL